MDMQSLIVLAATIGVFVLFWYVKRPDVNADEARKMIEEGARLVDVRTPQEFTAGHIKGARNLPVDRLGEASKELGAKDRPIIVYCASGTRSAIAKRNLKSQGFTSVYNLGPMSAWG